MLTRKPKYDLDKMDGAWKKASPVLGNVLELLTPNFHRKFLQWSDKFGGINRFKFLWHDVVLVTDPTALGVIMGRGEGAVDKAFETYAPINKMCDPHGQPNLLTAQADDRWKAIRKAVAVSFSAQNIKRKFPMILERVNEVVRRSAKLGPKASIDVDQTALRVTLDVIGLAGFNHDYGCVHKDVPEYEHLIRVLPRCFTEVMLRVANPLRPIFPNWFKGGDKGAKAFAMFQAEMRTLLNEMKQRGPPPEDDQDIAAQLYRVRRLALLDHVQPLRHVAHAARRVGAAQVMSENPSICEDRILSEIGMLFVEGFETTGHTTSWTLFNIASVPGVQDKIAEELDSLGLLAKPGCPPPKELQLDDLKRVPYLVAATKEAMRMLPVVSIMGRMTTKTTKIGSYTVPPGTIVATPLFAIQNTIHNWDKPEDFVPERWLDVPVETYVYDSTTNTSGGKRGITFMPFSEGPRNCVGQSLAKMEVLTLLAKLVGNFHLELAQEMGGRAGVISRESTHLTLQSAGTKGIRCHLHPRSENVAAGIVAA
ncbi:cytochrome P450 [Scenedesmus sp. NREL 46B-D3]|nr:cytochrome P450 [Scenedesmus sp. NREL 46B-D3]